jgi:hypothetical protein
MIDLPNEGLLKQLGYTPNPAMLSKLDNVIENTKDFEVFDKHIINLNDILKQHDSYVGISNSHDYLKIKSKSSSKEAEEIIHNWADKYKVDLAKLDGTDTYYILGKK